MPPTSNPDDPTVTIDPSSSGANQKTVPSKPNMIGTMVGGRYLIEKEIGRGGIGAVYLARDKPELMSRRVVVKVLLEDSLKNEWVVQKFQQEIESLTRLDDPGVVGVFDAGKLEDGSPFLVMQFVDGVSLREEIKQGGMDLMRAANIMRQIGRTLQVAHAEGVIHRDLKPENIMLRRVTSADEQVKVIDFGIAKVKNSVVAPSTVTGAGVAGTISYMPSEQLQAQPITPATDIYALGAIAYEMLTGTKPFNPETGFQLLEMQREGVRVRPKDLRPAISEQAQDVILRALSFDPKARYQNAAVFGDALANALSGTVTPLEMSTAEVDVSGGRQTKKESEAAASAVARSADTSPGSGQRKSMELAHVLFLDIVGYTRVPIDLQTQTMERLNEILRGTEDFVRSQASKQLLRLPSGDGMALVFFGDVEAPVRCAVEVSKALRSHPDIKLRMGVHSGPVDPIKDVNDIAIVTGTGINTAARVMDAGDNGHILLSKRVADDLGQYSRWKDHLHDLGEVTIKNTRVHIVNLYTDEAGNPELPEKFKKGQKRPFPFVAVAAALLVIVIAGALAYWAPWKRTTRTLTYSLTVQKMEKDKATNEYKPVGDPFNSAGDVIYGNGWEFHVNITPEQSGSLYLLNEGAGEGGAVVYNVLFPTPANNNSVAQLAAGQNMKTGQYFFNEFKGAEKLWIIWSAQPLAELDGIFKASVNNKLVISDPAQIKTVRAVLAKYDSSKPDVHSDKSKKQTTVKGTGDVLVSLLELQHEHY